MIVALTQTEKCITLASAAANRISTHVSDLQWTFPHYTDMDGHIGSLAKSGSETMTSP